MWAQMLSGVIYMCRRELCWHWLISSMTFNGPFEPPWLRSCLVFCHWNSLYSLGGWLSKGPNQSSGDVNDNSEGLRWDWQCSWDPCESDALLSTMSASWGPKHRSLTQAPMLILLPLLFCSSISSITHCHRHISAPLFPPAPTPPHCQPLPPLPFSLSLPLRPVFLFKLLLFPSFSF